MKKTFTKHLFFLALLSIITFTGTYAQTITVGNVDPGPYGAGSTIAVPITINDAATCIPQTDTFNLYLSDAAGNFIAGGTPIGSFTGFYTSFINGNIPPGTPAGAGYRVMVKTTIAPVVTSAASAPFTINVNTAVTAGASSQIISIAYPEVYGQCSGSAGTPFTFKNTSTAGATATATFYNEQTQTTEVSNVNIPATDYVFTANTANYTVTVKAVSAAGTVGTHAYLLINNVVNQTIGSTNSGTVCLVNGTGNLTVNIDISSSTGIQLNYPGNLYTLSWGDGSPPTVLTLCQIKALNGKVTHTYTQPLCGGKTVFQVSNPFCGDFPGAPSSPVSVVVPPKNIFVLPATGCAGMPISIDNTSDPGIDPATCGPNTKALYTWLLDGIAYQNYPLSQPFVIPATTPPGVHTITLQFQNSAAGCSPADVSHQICLQAAPKPIFTVPATACLANGSVIPTNTSIIDPGCNANNQYIWNVVGPAAVTYAGGTNANSQLPQFVFTTPGVYSVQLSITSASCGPVAALSQAIIVDGTPVATVSPIATFCGNNQTLIFDPTPGSKTQTILTGTGQAQPTTYTWVITGGAFSFQNNTTANSQYPIILFTDYATYTVAVTQVNNCGTITKSQTLTFVQAPTVTTSGPQAICASNPVAPLVGKIIGPYTSFQWTGGTGTFSAGRNSLITSYTPSAAEIAAGQVTLALLVTTALPAPCNQIPSNITINITPVAIINSSPAPPPICTGQSVNYAITANDPTSTYTWTASVTSGTATGFAATGSGNNINDVITDTDPNNPATVVYKITPKNSGCTGNVFTLTVTVNPLPAITAIPVSSPICSIQPANITLTSNIANTSYTWTSVAAAGITGNTNQANSVVTTAIQDVLINNASTPGTVTYTITPFNGTCSGTPIKATVIVQPLPVQSNPGQDAEICNTPIYTLQGNDPSPGTGIWTQTAGPAGVTFSGNTKPNAVASGLIAGNTYQFKWTITATPTCPSNSNAVNIIVDKPTIGGTTTNSGAGPVCSGINAGQVTLAGQQGNIIRWESSVDNGATWQQIVNVSTTQSYLNLTQTTQYRAVIQSGVCSILPSTVTIITVNPATVIADAGGSQGICNQTSTTLNGNDPAPFTGTWTQTAGLAVVIVDPTNPKTQITGLTTGNVYTFKWTIKGLPPCSDSEASVNISASSDITASFTTDKTRGCGPTTVTFTNTSTPTTAGIFLWDFGDGSPTSNQVTPPPHTFTPSLDGKEITYTVTLTPVGNCNLKTPFTTDIKVSPAIPVARLFPSQTSACGAFTLTAQNTSPGNNVSYDFYLTDKAGNPLQHITKTDKSDVVFQPVNPTKPTDYTVYVIATDQCGTKGTSTPINVSGSPSSVISLTQIKGDPQSVCLGNSITLQNISSGGDRFTYTIYDANKNPITTIPAGLADFVYTPTAVGTYYVSITAGNNGCGDAPESALKQFIVYAIPQANFTYKLDDNYNVTFTNTTAADGNIPASSLSYNWLFGDGTAEAGYGTKVHHYDYEKSPFTVTLMATNAASGCVDAKTETVIVNFLGGVFLPNAFIPSSSNSELKTFIAKGNSIKEWRMQIFNNFGELIWETTKLDSNGSPAEGWDGTFKGIPAQQGVYVWQVSATFINGTQWKGMSYNHSLPRRIGTIHLIR